MKKEIRVLGIDDCPFNKFKDKKTKIIGTIFRGGNFLDGVVSEDVDVDGKDSTDKIIKLAKKTKFSSQIRWIMLDGINVAGFNVVDIGKIYEKTNIPVLVVMRSHPDSKKIKKVLKKLCMDEKIPLLDKAGTIQKINEIYVQFLGAKLDEVEEVLEITCTHSFIPEPIRVAHLIAAGFTKGESKGKA